MALVAAAMPIPPGMEDDDKGIGVPIRIAVPDAARCEPDTPRPIFEPDHPWKVNSRRAAEATAGGKIRIPVAMLAKNGGVPGPRITIP